MGKKELEKKMMYLENEMHNLRLSLSLDKARDVLKSKLDLKSKVIDILGFNEDSFKNVQIMSVQVKKCPYLHNIATFKYHGAEVSMVISKLDYNTIVEYYQALNGN